MDAKMKLIVFIIVGAFGINLAPARAKEPLAIAEMVRLGAKVKRDEKKPGKPVVYISLAFTDATDGDLKYLAVFESLEEVSVAYTQVTDEGLVALGKCAKLKRIHLSNTKIEGSGLKS